MGDLIIKPASSGNLKIQDQGGTERIALDTSGNITAVLGDSVTMASSGLTVRNITQVALASDQTLVNDATDTTYFSPTYTPLFSGSKVQGILFVFGFIGRSGASDGRKNLKLNFTGSGITDLTTYDSNENIGSFDHGGGGITTALQQSIGGQLLTTNSTATITCNCKLKNPQTGSNSSWTIYGNDTLTETHFTWVEYK